MCSETVRQTNLAKLPSKKKGNTEHEHIHLSLTDSAGVGTSKYKYVPFTKRLPVPIHIVYENVLAKPGTVLLLIFNTSRLYRDPLRSALRCFGMLRPVQTFDRYRRPSILATAKNSRHQRSSPDGPQAPPPPVAIPNPELPKHRRQIQLPVHGRDHFRPAPV